MTGNTRLNCYTFLLLFCSKQWNASYGVNNTLCSTIKITSFWLAKQITPICFRIILIIAQICREIAVHNDFQQLRTINGQDLQQAPLLDGCIFLLPSNKSAKIPRPIAFVSCISKCSYMLMERTIVFSKSASTSMICGDEWSFAASLFGGLRCASLFITRRV